MILGKNIVLETTDKSFLRLKWEKILKEKILKRIPSQYQQNNQIVYLNNENEIKDFFLNSNVENIKKTKIIVILIPLNNFVNLINFLDSIDNILNQDT